MALRDWVVITIFALWPKVSLFASHNLNPEQSAVLTAWLKTHSDYRLADDRDCMCDEDIQKMRAGFGGDWKPVSDYHPYIANGDFNGDGITDFAVVVISTQLPHDFTLLVSNEPADVHHPTPAFVDSHRDLTRIGLFYGPPRPKPYRLVVGPFESEGLVLQPHGHTYHLVDQE